ncbi:MAG: response regulator [Myxococcales bacterium]|nr:response regulator [Myxococcales bacterium]
MADKLRLLIVDDSKIARAQVGAIIDEIDSAEVAGTAKNGLAAISIVESLHPDLILMDIVMPEMDGLSALRLMRAKNPDVRVAMVTSLGGSGSHAEESFRLGAVQVVGKPFDSEQIKALIDSELSFHVQED